MSDESLRACERALGYEFRNSEWLRRALTHSSNRASTGNTNERMEFFGDSILGMIVAQHLFDEYPDFPEGRLSKIRSVVVSRPVLAKCAQAIGLDSFVQVGPGMPTGSLPETVIANAFEALIAAIYIDGGFEAARRFLMRTLEPEIDRVVADRHERNYKSLLQQLVQRKESITPTYRVVAERGPDHAKLFCVATVIGERVLDSAWGPSKKAAEQLAAEKTYKHLLEVYGTRDE